MLLSLALALCPILLFLLTHHPLDALLHARFPVLERLALRHEWGLLMAVEIPLQERLWGLCSAH